jgi:UDP-N-acetylglucosamine--N-acetylmuramyl-(pentapeptide) pyrophosphoryl-undecaprenol N-acetylglucosamine transferase
VVPLPGAIDDHQSANAAALAAAGGAIAVAQTAFSSAALRDRIAGFLADPGALVRAAAAARTQARTDAAARLADLVQALMRQPEPATGSRA